MSLHHVTKRQSFGGGDGGSMPSLWVFLVIVLGVLLALVVGTSAIMHLIQARQRRNLARRIARGEIDLELLGLKRMNVPKEQVDKMPKYVYTATSETEVKEPDAAVTMTPTTTTTTAAASSEVRHSTMYAQSTCSICLDDFVHGESTVRELPCKHIFHPECIDSFLTNNSSLCPLCKKSALPAGYCPVVVTNVMVRRERLGRTMRGDRRRATGNNPHSSRSFARGGSRPPAVQNNVPAQRPSAPTPTPDQDTELGTVESHQPDTQSPPPEIAAQGPEARRAWRRERLARQHSREFDQQGEEARQAEARRPWWRRVMGLS